MSEATPNSTASANSASETSVSTAAPTVSNTTTAPKPGNAFKEAIAQYDNPDGSKPIGKQQVQETPAEKAARIYKLKVDGVEEEVDLDALDDMQLVKQLQMAKAASKRMQEAAEIRKAFKQFQENVKKDPLAVLKSKEFGELDVRKMVEEQILREYEESQLPEETRKLREMERLLKEREGQLQEIHNRQLQEAQAAFEAKVEAETEAELITALEVSDLPKNRETLAVLAQVAKINLEHGLELTPQQLAAEAKARIARMHGAVTKVMKGPQLIQHLGEDVVKEVLRYKLQSAKQQAQESMKAPTPQAQKLSPVLGDGPPQRQAKSARDFRKFVKGT